MRESYFYLSFTRQPATLLKVTLPPACFLCSLKNCINGTTSRKASHIFIQAMMSDKSTYSVRAQKKC